MSRLYTQATRPRPSDTQPERYALNATLPMTQHRIGEVKTIGGHTYVLNQHSRWERQDKDQASTPGIGGSQTPAATPAQQPQPGGAQPAQPKQRWKGDPGQSADHAARHDFTKQAMGQVQGPARGLMAALHSHPDIQNGKDYATRNVPQEHAKGLYGWLQQNAGQQTSGGQVVDLGQGRLGFSSPAGAVVVWPADASGKHKVGYTNKTGLVAQAMTGGKPGGQELGRQAGQPPGPPAIPTGKAVTGVYEPEAPPVQNARPQEPVTAEIVEDQPQAPAPQAQPQPQGAPPMLADFDPNERPKPAEAPPKTPQQEAEQAAAEHEAAVAMWRKEAPSLSPKGNARWRSYVAALRTIRHEKEGAAKRHAKGGPSAPAGQANSERARMEETARTKAPDAFKALQELGKGGINPDTYDDMLRQIVGEPSKPKAKSGGSREKDAMARLGIDPKGPDKERIKEMSGLDPDTGRPLLKEQPGQGPDDAQSRRPSGLSRQWNAGNTTGTVEFEHTDHQDLYDLGAKMRRSMTAKNFPQAEKQIMAAARTRLAKSLGISHSEVNHLAAHVHRTARQDMKGIGEGEHRKLKMPEAEKPSTGFTTAPPPASEFKTRGQQKLAALRDQHMQAAGFTPSDETKAHINKAIQSGRIAHPRHLRNVLKHAKRIHERTGSTGEESEAIRRAINAKANREHAGYNYRGDAKARAKGHGISHEDYEKHGDQLYDALVGHHKDREAAKDHARKVTGMTAGRVKQLEERGLDSATAKHFDELGQELLSHHPGLWGEDEDHGERLWELIKEGKKPAPNRRSRAYLDQLDEFLMSEGKRGVGPKPESDDSTPFTIGDITPEKYASAFDSSKHPRGQPKNAGQFRPIGKAGIVPHGKDGLGHFIEHPEHGKVRAPEHPDEYASIPDGAPWLDIDTGAIEHKQARAVSSGPSDEAAAALKSIRGRLGKEYQEFIAAGQGMTDDADDPETVNDYLASEVGMSVRDDGLIEFDRLTPQIKKLASDLPIVLYHHTTTALKKKLKNGLQIGKASNPHMNTQAGVYLTTQASGKDVDGYHANAVATHGGEPMTVEVTTTIPELSPDPDDEELAHAQGRQFVLPSVSADKVKYTQPGHPDKNTLKRGPLAPFIERRRFTIKADVATAASQTEQPTEAQAEAGNYRKGSVRMHGLTIRIENPKGSRRHPEWPPLSAHYGYISRTEGKDGDAVDVYIGPHPESEIVFVIDQVTEGGRFDEHKCVLGELTAEDAKALYLANYPADWKCGDITAMTVEQFKTWLSEGDTTKPVCGQVSKYSAAYDSLVRRAAMAALVG